MLNERHEVFKRSGVLAGAVTLLLVAAGCGVDDDGAGGATTATESTAAATIGTTEMTRPAGTTASPPASTAPPDTSDVVSTTEAPAASNPAACREIDHELGVSCVPTEPQRIVVLDTLMVLPTLVAASAKVVGSLSVYDVGDPFPAFVDATGMDIAIVGSLQTPNLELIAAADPDLIIGSSNVIQPIRTELEALAPIVATPYTYYVPTWRDDVQLVGDAAGVGDAVAASIEALDDRIATTRERLTTDGEGPAISRVDVFNGQPLYYQYACTAFGEVLLGAGVQQPAAQAADCSPDDFQSVLEYPSAENLSVLDGDLIVAYQQQAGEGDVGASPLDALGASPLWGQLGAVQAGNVHVVGDAWGLGASVPAFELMLDDLDRLVP